MLKQVKPAVFVWKSNISEMPWGWHNIGELAVCACNVSDGTLFTPHSLWTNFFALSTQFKFLSHWRKEQKLTWLWLESEGAEPEVHQSEPTWSQVRTENVFVPAGWGDRVLQVVRGLGVSARIEFAREHRHPHKAGDVITYIHTSSGSEIEMTE